MSCSSINNRMSSICWHGFALVLTCCVVVLSSFMGGNSTKATSGINGAGTQTQQEAGIPDNAKIFFEDTKKSVRSLAYS